jgi:hypothetical protein
MPARISETVWMQGWKKWLIYFVVFLVVCLPFAVLVSLSGRNDADISLVLWVFYCLILLGTSIHGRSVRGRILLDCGPNPGKIPLLAVALLSCS